MARFLILNGPNLNLLGTREPEVYGTTTLADITSGLESTFAEHQIRCRQSNAEHELVDWVQQARPGAADAVDWIIINAGAFTHTSVALRDALVGCDVPFSEVHISNVHARESFRHHSFLSDVARGIVVGFGPIGYELAVRGALTTLATRD